MDDLVTFIRARLDQDLHLAKLNLLANQAGQASVDPSVDRHSWALRDVLAKRQIVDMYESARRAIYTGSETADQYILEPVIRLLALPYADHPEYRQNWKP